MKLIVLLINFFLFVKSINGLETSLELVQILFRHGSRNPIREYFLDPYNETQWAKYGGYGQLTQLGMRNAYIYGQFIRKTYDGFLDALYNRNNVFVRSTDFDRTLMTAYSLLAGLFEPQSFQKWNDQINWQPIPVHTNEAKFDYIFNQGNCPRYEQLSREISKTQEYLDNQAKYSDVVRNIGLATGYSNITYDTLQSMSDGVFIEKLYNLTLPKWIEDNYEKLMEIKGKEFYFSYRTTEMAKLISGGVLNQMKLNIENRLNNQSSKTKLYLFSAHDTTVMSMVKLLNLTDYITQPPYLSSVILELRKSTQDSKYFVQAFFKNNTVGQGINLRPVTIYGCDSLCPIDQFFSLIQNLVVQDFSTACELEILSANLKFEFYSYFLLCSILALIFIFFSIISLFQVRKNYFKPREIPREYETVNLMVGDFNDVKLDD